MITSLGYGTYMFFGALMVLMGLWAYFCIPETKGKTLEQMELLFGAPSAQALQDAKSSSFEREKIGTEYVEHTQQRKWLRDKVAVSHVENV